MVRNERDIRHKLVVDAGERMMMAARTAPKAKGVDIVEIAMVSEREELEALSQAMLKKADECGMKFLIRDAENILQGEAVILIGTKSMRQGLNCGYCGYPSCSMNPQENPCAFNSVDVGIAIGAACSVAADLRVDTRVMFSAGWCSMDLEYLPGCKQVLAIALSASSKNPFFDRKPKEPAK